MTSECIGKKYTDRCSAWNIDSINRNLVFLCTTPACTKLSIINDECIFVCYFWFVILLLLLFPWVCVMNARPVKQQTQGSSEGWIGEICLYLALQREMVLAVKICRHGDVCGDAANAVSALRPPGSSHRSDTNKRE